MKVGIQLPEVERVVRWPEVAAMARAAEGSGYDSIWVGDHLLYRDPERPERGPWDAWTQLAALAAVTSRVRLGPLVAATAFHPPGMIARMAASIDEISGGRFVLGLGAGWNETEFRAFGFPFDHLASRFEESFEIVRRLLSGERVSLAGRFHAVDDAVLLPPPARRVPIIVGSHGTRVLSLTLPHVDGWNTWYDWHGNTAEGFAKRNTEIDELCVRAGREPRDVRRSACVLVALENGGERSHNARPVRPEQLRSHLRELAEAGADEAVLVVDPITERSIRGIAERIF
jgi:probable F420-dependent oxidoreductase